MVNIGTEEPGTDLAPGAKLSNESNELTDFSISNRVLFFWYTLNKNRKGI